MRIKALIIRIIRQFFHDKRSLGMLFVAPVLIMWFMSVVFDSGEYHPDIAVINVPENIMEVLEEEGATVESASLEESKKALENGEIDAIFSFEQTPIPEITLEGSDPTVNKTVIVIFQKMMQDLAPTNIDVNSNITYLHGSADMELFDSIGPVLLAYFAFFFVFLLSGIAFLRERTGGTLERLLVTPLKRWEIVTGYVLGFGIFAMIQAGIITWYSIDILELYMVGSLAYVLLVIMAMALTALTLGTFLSAFANNEFQMMQFIPIVIVPQIFFSGLFNMETMAEWLQYVGLVMPLTYGADALREVMIRGSGWSEIQVDVYALILFSFVFYVANIIALRKHRKM